MIKSILLIFTLLLAIVGLAQQESYYIPSDSATIEVPSETFNKAPFSSQKKLSLGVNMGSSFYSYGGGVFTSYIAPEIRYKASDKLSISVGTMASFSSFNNGYYNNESQQGDYAGRIAQYYMYANGTYQVNDMLRIRAGGTFEVTPNTQYQNFQSGHIGVELKLSENTFINADFQINNSYNQPGMYYSNGGAFGNNSNGFMHNRFPYTAW